MMRVKITRTPLWEWVRGAAELWRCRVPIGDTLAEARQRAGLTVAQVSEQTCIREAVIKGIEGDDYSACGGDFYARANIGSIARVVGADSGPLIAEYDALHRARGALSAVSLEELLATSIPAARPRRPGLYAVGGLLASGNAPPAHRAAEGSQATGPAHPQVQHRPPPEPVLLQGPAHGQAPPGHDHGRPGHHRRAPAVQQADGRSGQHLPDGRHHVRPQGRASQRD
jgi:hypothetical protein